MKGGLVDKTDGWSTVWFKFESNSVLVNPTASDPDVGNFSSASGRWHSDRGSVQPAAEQQSLAWATFPDSLLCKTKTMPTEALKIWLLQNICNVQYFHWTRKFQSCTAKHSIVKLVQFWLFQAAFVLWMTPQSLVLRFYSKVHSRHIYRFTLRKEANEFHYMTFDFCWWCGVPVDVLCSLMKHIGFVLTMFS